MAFPDIHEFPPIHAGPYERQMGGFIAALLRLFHGRVPDSDSNARVTELAETPDRWSAGHALFNAVRGRLLAADGSDLPRQWQHHFEESCCQALYNATDPPDPFDPGSAFFVAPHALALARAIGLPPEAVVTVLVPDSGQD
jgi:hypothetical protein